MTLPFRLDRSVVIHAEPAAVFRYVQDPDKWAAWWGTGSTIEATRGGRLLIRHTDSVDVVGEVREIQPPGRIVFSYGFLDRHAEQAGDSEVTITLEPIGHLTRLHLTHEFNDLIARNEHVQGWRFQLSILANLVADEVHADVAKAIDGLDDLVAHTGAYQRFFPGLRFERRGDVRHCQGVVLADWVTRGDETTARLNGTCCFTFNTANQIEAVINFISPSGDQR